MKAIIFDMDGTLVDSMTMWSNVGNRYIAKCNLPFLRDVQLVTAEKTYNERTQELIDLYGLPLSLQQIKQEFDVLVREEYYEKLLLKPYVKEYVEQCAADGILMSVATATSSYLARACLERLGLLRYFSVLLSVKDIGVNKFQPDIYLQCAEAMGTPREETAVFEDAPYAAETAHNAGFYVVGIYERQVPEDFDRLAPFCDRRIRNFQELIR